MNSFVIKTDFLHKIHVVYTFREITIIINQDKRPRFQLMVAIASG